MKKLIASLTLTAAAFGLGACGASSASHPSAKPTPPAATTIPAGQARLPGVPLDLNGKVQTVTMWPADQETEAIALINRTASLAPFDPTCALRVLESDFHSLPEFTAAPGHDAFEAGQDVAAICG